MSGLMLPSVASCGLDWPGDARSARLPDVAMMQAPDFGNLHDDTRLGALDGPPVWRILLKREVSASAVIIGEG